MSNAAPGTVSCSWPCLGLNTYKLKGSIAMINTFRTSCGELHYKVQESVMVTCGNNKGDIMVMS